ncbi:MAG: Rne/Rng family ribonuclease [Hyphomicrobiaceae bacterium]
MDHKANKMLIDATHPEETRVVVLKNGRVEEFDFESAQRKQLRGNIYLAKVTRVEPSLQAAFIEYGGNRHGFLAFSEIHPDYYQIPMADRQALIEEEALAEAEADAEADARAERRASRGPHSGRDGGRGRDNNGGQNGGERHEQSELGEHGHSEHGLEDAQSMDALPSDAGGHEAQDHSVHGQDEQQHIAMDASHNDPVIREAAPQHTDEHASEHGDDRSHAGSLAQRDDHIEEVPENAEAPEVIGSGADVGGDDDDGIEEMQSRPRRPRRRVYKIQEVIKRRQVILVQVVKEERGNKGAALTTYLSLAGRYTVLMPNTGRGGGISRKITNAVDRKRLKSIAQELDVPEGMGLIIRTAGAARTNQEIRRDYEYLLRLWESVRELTLSSTAPSLVYEEGNLIKRSIRDLYSKDIDEVVVAGDAAFDESHDFMRMMMPSHAKNVTKHAHPEALFARYQIERQLNQMFSPQVTLKSGGYIVINQTEALVAIDVNSGRSTREYSIEETALNTNLEASDEIARQLKLRDLAGLIVIDFIDMEEKRNNRAVERRLKDALRFDRARIQVGRISHFGLMEMSRQRMRTGMLEGSTSQCPHCQGSGVIRSTESIALAVLRGIEDHLTKESRSSVSVLTTATVALYILNNKRAFISDIEDRFGVAVAVQSSDRMHGANFAIERSAAPVQPKRVADRSAVKMDWGFDGDEPQASDAHSDDQHGDDDHFAPLSRPESVDGDEDRDYRSDRGDRSERSDRGNRNERGDRGEREARTGDAGDTRESSEGGEGGEGGRRRRRRRRRGRDRERGPHSDTGGNGDGLSARNGDGDRDEVDEVGGNLSTDNRGGDRGDDRADIEGEALVSRDGGQQPRRDAPQSGDEDGDGQPRRRRRRGRRGGRRGREFNGNGDGGNGDGQSQDAAQGEQERGDRDVAEHVRDTRREHRVDDQGLQHGDTQAVTSGHVQRSHEPREHLHEPVVELRPQPVAVREHETPKPVVAPVYTPAPVHVAPIQVAQPAPEPERPKPPVITELPAVPDDPTKPVRKGWWQRRILGE